MIAQLDKDYIKMRPSKAYVRLVSHLFFQGRFLTTNHRWLNRLILAELWVLKQLPSIRSVSKPIFIVGIGRSGSTILGTVLSMHKDVGFLNEPKAMWYSLIPEDDVNGHFSHCYAQYEFDGSHASEKIVREAHHLFGQYLTITGTRRVLDKNPEIVFRIPFIKKIFPDAKIIFLVRNGWDTIASITRWSIEHAKKDDGSIEDWWGINQRKWEFMNQQLVPQEPTLSHLVPQIQKIKRHEEMAAVEWILTMQAGMRQLQRMPECTFQVRYEDLTHSPRQTLKKLVDFCELDNDKTFYAYAEKKLRPNCTNKPCTLSLDLMAPFQTTMSALGYILGNESSC